MSLELHAAVLKAALNDTLDPRQAYDADDIQKLPEASRPRQYVELGLSYRYRPPLRLRPIPERRAVRLTTRYVADSETNVRTLQEDCWTALDTVSLLVDSHRTTPVAHETGTQPAPDEGMWSAIDTWTYVS